MKHKLFICLFIFMSAVASMMIAGCVSQTPVPQYAENLTFAVAYTHDDMNSLSSSEIKDSVTASLNSVLTERNLKVHPISFHAIEQQLLAVRDTDRRIQALRASATGAQLILFSEISTEFYSPLSGRYRWDVNVNLTIYDMINRHTLNDKFTVPVALMYSHEDGDDAIAAAQIDIQRHMGSLIDAFMKGRSVRTDAELPPATRAAEPKPVAPAPTPAPEPVVATPVEEPKPTAEEPDSSTDPAPVKQESEGDSKTGESETPADIWSK